MQKQRRERDKVMEENYSELMLEIAKLLQKKYTCMSEINRLTEEMAEELSSDDRVSVQMTLGMRGEEIEKMQDCNKHLSLFVENVSPEMKDWLLKVLEGGQGSPKYGKEGMLVMRLAASIRTAWEKTMAIDRHMNKRLAGADSFYADKQNQVM